MSGLFREEALAELRNRGGPGDVLRTTPRWLNWSLWVLLALVAAALLAAVTIRVPEHARGDAVLAPDGFSVTAVLPSAFRDRVEEGGIARVEFVGVRRTGSIDEVRPVPQGLRVRVRLQTRLPDLASRTGRLTVRVRGQTIYDLLRG